ncbi:hypothetical protein [Thalassotalea sp. ND16A]|uniref:hypothetical protein n=1 Tax=Thalassotalea sp. ND16A TaxID=1535422 RepID=UPI00051DDFC2|nr:hypothetical protein [Thalassotalea sp. ND16A]KGJ88158.1 hypothetical protein ND16A_2711 [Thalassotalea sp. ND16A]
MNTMMALCAQSYLQLKSNTKVLSVCYLVLALAVLSIYVAAHSFNISPAVFTRDPVSLLRAPLYTGLMSNVGILLWVSSAAVCLFSAYTISRYSGRTNGFLLYSGYLTLWLVLDDLFLFHEELFPDYLGISQGVIILIYLLLFLVFFVKYLPAILASDFVLLLLACTFFAASLVCDFALPQRGMVHLVEDSFKLFGITTWLVYFCQASKGLIESSVLQAEK